MLDRAAVQAGEDERELSAEPGGFDQDHGLANNEPRESGPDRRR
jgi:hypothetical protein